jgi:hypothetical protein
MGFDIDECTTLVLSGGLPPLPASLEPGKTLPLARGLGDHYGAVLFVRRWRNDNVDCDVAILARDSSGSWAEFTTSSGSAWIDDPLTRSESGWNGEQVLWLGISGRDDVRVVRGAASDQVAAIRLKQEAQPVRVYSVDSSSGAFLVGIESPGPAQLEPLSRSGETLFPTQDVPSLE